MKISVRVHPNAPRSQVTGFEGGVWQIKVAAPPLKGRANRELEIFLSQRLQVSKSAVSVVKGQTSQPQDGFHRRSEPGGSCPEAYAETFFFLRRRQKNMTRTIPQTGLKITSQIAALPNHCPKVTRPLQAPVPTLPGLQPGSTVM